MASDEPMTREAVQEMWKKVYRAERDRFESERDEARQQLADALAATGSLEAVMEAVAAEFGACSNVTADRIIAASGAAGLRAAKELAEEQRDELLKAVVRAQASSRMDTLTGSPWKALFDTAATIRERVESQ